MVTASYIYRGQAYTCHVKTSPTSKETSLYYSSDVFTYARLLAELRKNPTD
jgi:hypothetical protein